MAKRWTEEEEQFLKDNYSTLSLEEQAEILDRSVNSIMSRARRIGLKRYRYWTEEDEQFLKDNCKGRTYDELAKLMPNRTRSSIEFRCQQLGLNKYIKDGRQKTEWTDEEIKFLKTNHGKIEIKDMAKLLKKSKAAINYKIRDLDINCQRIWSDEEIEILKMNANHRDIYDLERLLGFNKTRRQIYKKLSNLGLNTNRAKVIKYQGLPEVFKDYKRILDGEIKGFTKQYPKEYDIILFKYYLKRTNINPTKEWVYNLHFSKFLRECKLWSRIKKQWYFSFEFISACFPRYNLKEYDFKILQVREGFWDKDYNCFDNIREGIKRLYRDGIIQHDSQILNLDFNTIYQYFSRTMIYYKGIGILYAYLDFFNIKYNKRLIHDEIKFDSMEELSVYKYIKHNFFQNIEKYKGTMFYNKKNNESYIPDFIIKDKNIIIEYFGLYVNREHEFIKDYRNKTHRKIKYFNNIEGYEFIDLYPDDLKNDFEGVRNKLTPFIMQKKGSDCDGETNSK